MSVRFIHFVTGRIMTFIVRSIALIVSLNKQKLVLAMGLRIDRVGGLERRTKTWAGPHHKRW